MADEQQFIEEGLERSQIDEFFAEELGRAGYGGMEMAQTPMGDQIVLKAEKPGMVIGKGGQNIREITDQLETRFDLEDPQIDVQEVDEPDLNARIVADRLANALERGWYFRKAGHTTIDRIMEAGALGAEIVLSGKVTGARSRVEKFNRGYIKHNGEPAEDVVDHGQGVAVMKLGTIGVDVKIIPPGADLPDDFQVREGADTAEFAPEDVVEDEGVGELLEEPEADADEDDDGEAPEPAPADEVEPPEPADDVEEVDPAEEAFEEVDTPDGDDVEEELEEIEAAVEDDLDEDTAAEAEELVEEMDEAADDADEDDDEEGES